MKRLTKNLGSLWKKGLPLSILTVILLMDASVEVSEERLRTTEDPISDGIGTQRSGINEAADIGEPPTETGMRSKKELLHPREHNFPKPNPP